MLALQVVKAEAGGFYLPNGVLDVPWVGRVELDRVIRRRLEIGYLPGARVIESACHTLASTVDRFQVLCLLGEAHSSSVASVAKPQLLLRTRARGDRPLDTASCKSVIVRAAIDVDRLSGDEAAILAD